MSGVDDGPSTVVRADEQPLPAISTAHLARLAASEATGTGGSPPFVGPYAATRAKLDYSYHQRPSVERQKVQDAIVARTLRHRLGGGHHKEKEKEKEKEREAKSEAASDEAALVAAGTEEEVDVRVVPSPSPLFSPLLSSHASQWAFSKPPPDFMPTSASSVSASASAVFAISPGQSQPDLASPAAFSPTGIAAAGDGASTATTASNASSSITTSTTTNATSPSPLSSPSKSPMPMPLLPRPWILYSAGAMGAGKSRTLRYLHAVGAMPLHAFVMIDPDKIKQALPELSTLARDSPTAAHTLLHRESGFIAEIIEREAMDAGRSVVVDGSLRDCKHYAGEIARIRREYPHFRIGILWISASPETVHRRAEKRARQTGRHVPLDVLDAALKQVPTSFAVLSPLVDYAGVIDNDKDDADPVFRPPSTLQEFASLWTSDAPAKKNSSEAVDAAARCSCHAADHSSSSASAASAASAAVGEGKGKEKEKEIESNPNPSTSTSTSDSAATSQR